MTVFMTQDVRLDVMITAADDDYYVIVGEDEAIDGPLIAGETYVQEGVYDPSGGVQ